MRYIAFPSSYSQIALSLIPNIQYDTWTIIAGPTESGLYIIEATQETIEGLKQLYDGFYIFMEDFEQPN